MFQIWTTKEAYTKAIGAGLKFDLARIECRFREGIEGPTAVAVDGSVAEGWEFLGFGFQDGAAQYVGMAAALTGQPSSFKWIELGEDGTDAASQFKNIDVIDLLQTAIQEELG